jgi:hypothetical protein
MKTQIKVFDDVIGTDTTKEVNKFLIEMGVQITRVTPMYNAILGGVIYVVEYVI